MNAPTIRPQLDQFEEEGWAIVDDVFTAAECDEMISHIEQAAFEVDLGQVEDGQMKYRPMMTLYDPYLERMAGDQRWADIVLPIIGPDARLYWEQSVAKPPDAGTVLPWHQDNGYTPLIPEAYLSCWLALDDADVENGGLQIIPGSHKQGTVPHHDDTGSNPYFRVGHDGGEEAGVQIPVRKGSVLCFSSLIMHRSGPNRSGRERRAWILQYCSAGARSKLSGRVLDDRLKVADGGAWLDAPYRDRDFDVQAVIGNYQTDRARG